MLKQIQKQLNTIMQMRDTYPSKIIMNRKQYEELVRECEIENNKILNLQIKIDDKTNKFKIE